MSAPKVTMQVRQVNGIASIIDIQGDLTATADQLLAKTYEEANTSGIRAIILNFSDMEYMNSSGIGLIVTLLIRVNRQKQQMLAYGLSEHYQHIFRLTRLTDAIKLYASEGEAIQALKTLINPAASPAKPRFFGRK